jgi:hypothetical protein
MYLLSFVECEPSGALGEVIKYIYIRETLLELHATLFGWLGSTGSFWEIEGVPYQVGAVFLFLLFFADFRGGVQCGPAGVFNQSELEVFVVLLSPAELSNQLHTHTTTREMRRHQDSSHSSTRNSKPSSTKTDQLIHHIYSKSTQLIINARIDQPTTTTTTTDPTRHDKWVYIIILTNQPSGCNILTSINT